MCIQLARVRILKLENAVDARAITEVMTVDARAKRQEELEEMLKEAELGELFGNCIKLGRAQDLLLEAKQRGIDLVKIIEARMHQVEFGSKFVPTAIGVDVVCWHSYVLQILLYSADQSLPPREEGHVVSWLCSSFSNFGMAYNYVHAVKFARRVAGVSMVSMEWHGQF